MREEVEGRGTAGLLLDLLGEVEVHEGRAVLAAAAQHDDPWLALWGVVGLFRSGSTVADTAIEKVAANAEARLPLLGRLEALGQLKRCPIQYRNQAAIAESDMVRWLTFPTELGRVPDDIEQIAVVPVNTDDGVADLYVYRFRTLEPHWAAKDGWLMGWAGAFLRSEQPTMWSLGDTFSRFETFASKTVGQHVDAILEMITGVDAE